MVILGNMICNYRSIVAYLELSGLVAFGHGLPGDPAQWLIHLVKREV